MSTDSLMTEIKYEMNLSFPHSWRPVAVLLAFQAGLVALALSGLARADEPVSPTLRVLLSVPRHVSDLEEDDGQREERLKEIAAAIDAATPHAHERALLLAKGKHETWWASYIHYDLPRCSEGHGGRCDNGESWSPWQLKYTDRQGGVDRAAKLAIAELRRKARACGFRSLNTTRAVRAAISGYAVGNGCSWSGADERVATWREYLARLGGGQ